MAVGAKAEKFSAGFAHPEAIAGDSEIRKILPHRYPFLLVDKILECVPGEYAVGVKCITSNEPQFTGHFPDRPIMPGVLQVEAMAQLGGFVALQPPLAEPGQDFFFGGVDNVKWRKPLVPGTPTIFQGACNPSCAMRYSLVLVYGHCWPRTVLSGFRRALAARPSWAACQHKYSWTTLA